MAKVENCAELSHYKNGNWQSFARIKVVINFIFGNFISAAPVRTPSAGDLSISAAANDSKPGDLIPNYSNVNARKPADGRNNFDAKKT